MTTTKTKKKSTWERRREREAKALLAKQTALTKSISEQLRAALPSGERRASVCDAVKALVRF